MQSIGSIDLLFGGYGPANVSGIYTYYTDTWKWDGSSWTQLSPSVAPPGRFAGSIAFDPAAGVLVFGGLGQTLGYLNDLWVFDGSDWGRAGLVRPDQRSYPVVIADEARNNMVLFAGGVYGTLFSDTWTWDGAQWSLQHPPISPSPRQEAVAAYQPSTQKVVLFGGATPSAGSSGTSLGDTWTWDGSIWFEQTPVTSPSARQDAVMAYDPATGQMVLFGGAGVGGNVASFLNDTWTWDGTNWFQQHPDNPPPARTGATLVYDPVSARLILFGGSTLSGLVQDTWAWDGSQWAELTPVHTPSPRQFAASFHDPTSGEAIIFAGSGTACCRFLDDTWFWNGSDWTELDMPLHPDGRNGAGMADGTGATPPLLFGGYMIAAYLGDSWIWAAPVQLVKIVSRKTHGGAGTFDIDLTTGIGLECRSGGANDDYMLVFTFAHPLTSVDRASVTSGAGSVSNSTIDGIDARHYIVNLTGVANAQTVTVNLTNVSDAAGDFSHSVPISMGVLLGDVNASGRVDAADVSSVRQQTLQDITNSNFRNDLNASGRIDAADVSIARQQSLTSLP
jgi:hypothetical protein